MLLLAAATPVAAADAYSRTRPTDHPRWTERQAENALLSRAHIAYADCVSPSGSGRRFLCLIEYRDGGEWFLVIVPERDGFSVQRYERA